ncbi:MAG: glycosyltransferase family 2 protein [Rhodopirellula sp.]|nr:glycosyltransferase family 2 protein [Rhodopirellula sp.]
MVATSVIVVNYNGIALLADCLNSLAAQTYRDFEVIFVDNGSSDGSVAQAVALMPDVRIVALNENLGFAGGNNAGIRRAQGSNIVLLNNDTLVDPHFLEELVRGVDCGRRVGMVAPKILNYYDRTRIDSVGGLVLCRDGLGQGRGRGERDEGQYDGLGEVLVPSGCAALFRRELLDECGLFDERFFAYCEDMDLGLRACWAGWVAVSAPEAVVYHKYSGSSGAYSPLKMFLVERNHFFVALKNFTCFMLLALPLWSVYRYLLMAYVVATGKGKGKAGAKWELASALVRAHFAAIAACPSVLRSKSGLRRIAPGQFAKLLRRHRLSLRQMILSD